MTYQQLFDEVIGDAPVSTVDVEQVIGRQRRARRLRTGAAGTAVAGAVFAVVLGATSLAGTPRADAPAPPATTPSPAPAITTTPGTPEDRARIEAAIVTAVQREIPDLVWMTKWGGADSPRPRWMASADGRTGNRDFHQLGAATYRVGDRAGQLWMQLDRNGGDLFAGRAPCPTFGLAARNCAVSTGPAGEKIRARRWVNDFGRYWDRPSPRPGLADSLHVEVLRVDGTLVSLLATTGSEQFSLERLTAIAVDPAVALSSVPVSTTGPQPPAFPFDEHGMHLAADGNSTTALGAALEAVAPQGRVYLWSAGLSGGRKGPSAYRLGFALQRDGLAGDGEVSVRRWNREMSCSAVAVLPEHEHERHPHVGRCTESTRGGNRVVTVVARRSGTVVYTVFVQRPDRTYVEVVLDNRPNSGAPDDMPERGGGRSVWPQATKGGPTPPLTLDELTELAAHPDLVNLLP